jgi:hypothetical protein
MKLKPRSVPDIYVGASVAAAYTKLRNTPVQMFDNPVAVLLLVVKFLWIRQALWVQDRCVRTNTAH